MKIWQQFRDSDKGFHIDSTALDASDQGIYDYYPVEMTRFTRIDKVVKSTLEVCTKMEARGLMVSLSGPQNKVCATLEGLGERFCPDHLVLDYDYLEAHIDELKETGINLHAHMRQSASRDYERLFRFFADHQCASVIVPSELFTRGHIALAHRFGIHVIIADVMYERHIEKVRKSEAVGCILVHPL